MVLLQLERNLEYVGSKELITKAEAEAEEKKREKGKGKRDNGNSNRRLAEFIASIQILYIASRETAQWYNMHLQWANC